MLQFPLPFRASSNRKTRQATRGSSSSRGLISRVRPRFRRNLMGERVKMWLVQRERRHAESAMLNQTNRGVQSPDPDCPRSPGCCRLE